MRGDEDVGADVGGGVGGGPVAGVGHQGAHPRVVPCVGEVLVDRLRHGEEVGLVVGGRRDLGGDDDLIGGGGRLRVVALENSLRPHRDDAGVRVGGVGPTRQLATRRGGSWLGAGELPAEGRFFLGSLLHPGLVVPRVVAP